MPTKKRLTVPGALHHVMAKGISGRTIFSCDDDRRLFLTLLSAGIARTGHRCYAWGLMDNHYHLVLRASERRLDALMRPLNAAYAKAFNRVGRRTGYVFQDRYRSIVTQDQGYLEQLVRYVHLNPLRAGICRSMTELERYPWSGHSVLMGHTSNSFQNTRDVLRRFGRTVAGARKAYRAFLAEGIGEERQADTVVEALRASNTGSQDMHGPISYVIGDPEFVRSALSRDRQRLIRLARYHREGWTMERLLKVVAAHFRVTGKDIRQRGKGHAAGEARKVFCWLAFRELGFAGVTVARYLGISGPAVSAMIRRADDSPEAERLPKLIN